MIAFSYHLSKSLDTIYLLKNYQDNFEIETLVITNAKCQLLQDNKIEDFNVNGFSVYVSQTSNGYNLECLNYVFDITVNDNLVIDYVVHRLVWPLILSMLTFSYDWIY